MLPQQCSILHFLIDILFFHSFYVEWDSEIIFLSLRCLVNPALWSAIVSLLSPFPGILQFIRMAKLTQHDLQTTSTISIFAFLFSISFIYCKIYLYIREIRTSASYVALTAGVSWQGTIDRQRIGYKKKYNEHYGTVLEVRFFFLLQIHPIWWNYHLSCNFVHYYTALVISIIYIISFKHTYTKLKKKVILFWINCCDLFN